MAQVALIIIYNHKYDQNIPALEELYGERFSNIYHLVPFYSGTKKNVIPVYENSFYFHGYIAQGLRDFYETTYQHYLFIGDDLFLNPVINESNYTNHFKLNRESCFFPGYQMLHEFNRDGKRWERVTEAFHYKPNNVYGLETINEIPNYATAVKLFEGHGLSVEPLQYDQINTPVPKPKFNALRRLRRYYIEQARRFKHKKKRFNTYYPLAGGYSDIFVVSSSVIKKFSHYCGVFATEKLFVEFAIPTALILAAETIVQEKEMSLYGKALWSAEDFKYLDKYEYHLDKLHNNFPCELLYLHPIKLSRWKKQRHEVN